MFFPERIKSIKTTDKVLEIGPGGTPFWRSDVFLELKFEDEIEFRRQRGNVDPLQTEKLVVFYDGEIFPFNDNEFDYVICSHVLEHVPNVPLFLKEMTRVAKKGYLEYPTVYYDYLYNIPEHLNLLMYKDGLINWIKKESTSLNDFKGIQYLFFKQLESETSNFVNELREYFVQGFEWVNAISFEERKEIADILFNKSDVIFNKPIINIKPLTLKDKVKIKLKLMIDKV